jgi:hypothetical protein
MLHHYYTRNSKSQQYLGAIEHTVLLVLATKSLSIWLHGGAA